MSVREKFANARFKTNLNTRRCFQRGDYGGRYIFRFQSWPRTDYLRRGFELSGFKKIRVIHTAGTDTLKNNFTRHACILLNNNLLGIVDLYNLSFFSRLSIKGLYNVDVMLCTCCAACFYEK